MRNKDYTGDDAKSYEANSGGNDTAQHIIDPTQTPESILEDFSRALNKQPLSLLQINNLVQDVIIKCSQLQEANDHGLLSYLVNTIKGEVTAKCNPTVAQAFFKQHPLFTSEQTKVEYSALCKSDDYEIDTMGNLTNDDGKDS